MEGLLELEALHKVSDQHARSRLMQVRGIGPWTADIYLLMALRRPDIWPTATWHWRLPSRMSNACPTPPDDEQLCEIAAAWQPWRAVAARILWHHYLS